MTAARPAHRISATTIIFLLMVAAAGGIAWYGIGMNGAGQPASPAQAATIAPAVPAGSTAVAGPRLAAGSLPTRIVIASAGIDVAVTEVGVVEQGGQATWETEWRAAGHHLDSARPGQPGNMVITGHVSVADHSNLAVFHSLNLSKAGDIVEVHSGSDVYRYAITNVFVTDPAATSILRSDHRAIVTLITCTPDLKHRLVVQGTLIQPG
jgi:sortase A